MPPRRCGPNLGLGSRCAFRKRKWVRHDTGSVLRAEIWALLPQQAMRAAEAKLAPQTLAAAGQSRAANGPRAGRPGAPFGVRFFFIPSLRREPRCIDRDQREKKTTKSIPSLTFLLLSISARLSHILYFCPHPPSRAFISSSQSKDAGCAELLGRADVRQVAGQPRRAGSPARLLRPPAEKSIANHPGSRAGGSTRPRRGSPSSRASRTPT